MIVDKVSVWFLLYALNNNNPPSIYVPSSTSFDVAAEFSNYVYILRANNGINVNNVLGSRSPFPHEFEIAIPGGVDPSDIRAVTLLRDGVSLLNPNYIP